MFTLVMSSAGGDGGGHADVVLLRVRLRVRDLGEGQAAAADVLQRHRACGAQGQETVNDSILNSILSNSGSDDLGNASISCRLHPSSQEAALGRHARLRWLARWEPEAAVS